MATKFVKEQTISTPSHLDAPAYGEAQVPKGPAQHLVVGGDGTASVVAKLADDHPLHPDNNDHKSYLRAFYEWAHDMVTEVGSGAMHEKLMNLVAHGRVLLGAANETYLGIKKVADEAAKTTSTKTTMALIAFFILFLLHPVVSRAQSQSVFPQQNNAQATAVGPAGALSNPTGNNIAVTPGPIFCNGAISYVHSVQFTLTGVQAIPATTTASGQSQLFYVFYRCSSDAVMMTIDAPNRANDVVFGTVLQSNSAGSLSYTITDLRSVLQFPNVSDGVIPFGPGDCAWNATGTLGATTGLNLQAIGASFAPVNSISTTAAGATVDNLTCIIHVPQRTTTGKGVILNDCTVYYGVQATALTSLGAPTLNTITMPAAGTGETPSTVTPVSLGAVTVTPVVGSANLGTTTAGAFFTEKVALNTPVALNTDLQSIQYNQTFNQSASAAQIVNTPGGVCHVSLVPL